MSIRIGDNVLNNGGTATFNGTSLTKIIYDGTTVWQKGIPIYVTMLNEFSGQITCSCVRADGTTLEVNTTSDPKFACVRLETCEPLSEQTRIELNIYCATMLCSSAVLPDGTQAYVQLPYVVCKYRWFSTYMDAGATCKDVCIPLTDYRWTFGPISDYNYTVCPAGVVLPEGINICYELWMCNYATGARNVANWCCGCTVVIPVR